MIPLHAPRLAEATKEPSHAPRWIIGLASGSSADGVDAALLELEGVGLDLRLRLVHGLHQPYGPELRELIRRVSARRACEIRQVSLLHRLLGETFAAAARGVADQASLSLQQVQCIGCPGHTVWHDPEGRFPSDPGPGHGRRRGRAPRRHHRQRLPLPATWRPAARACRWRRWPTTSCSATRTRTALLLHLGGAARVVFLPADGGSTRSSASRPGRATCCSTP